MKLTFIDNAKGVLARAYSMWATYLAIFFLFLEMAGPQIGVMLPQVKPLMSERLFAWLSFILVGIIPFLRTVKQAKLAVNAAQTRTEGEP